MALVPFLPKFCIGMLVGIIAAALGFGIDSIDTNTETIVEDGIFFTLVGLVIVAPILETFLGQWIPIFLTELFTKNTTLLVAISAMVFSILHIPAGLLTFIAILPVSFFFAWCFLVGREQSYWKAYWTTSVAHSIHNAFAFALFTATEGFAGPT